MQRYMEKRLREGEEMRYWLETYKHKCVIHFLVINRVLISAKVCVIFRKNSLAHTV